MTDPWDPAIAGFGRVQAAVYFDPGALIPARYIPQMLREQEGPRHNLLLVAEDDAGKVVGGALFHYLAATNVGFSSFMGVARAARGQGIARQLHAQRLRVLDEVAGRPVDGVFIDVVSPARLTPEEREVERRVGSDPLTRRQTFERLGFRQVDVEYQQPLGGPDGGPVTNLDLLFCPRTPRDTIPTELVVGTMQAYWSGWMGEQRARRFADQLKQRARGRSALALVSPVPHL